MLLDTSTIQLWVGQNAPTTYSATNNWLDEGVLPTAAQIKTLYESNTNTNAFTNTSKNVTDTLESVSDNTVPVMNAGAASDSPITTPSPNQVTIDANIRINGNLSAEQGVFDAQTIVIGDSGFHEAATGILVTLGNGELGFPVLDRSTDQGSQVTRINHGNIELLAETIGQTTADTELGTSERTFTFTAPESFIWDKVVLSNVVADTTSWSFIVRRDGNQIPIYSESGISLSSGTDVEHNLVSDVEGQERTVRLIINQGDVLNITYSGANFMGNSAGVPAFRVIGALFTRPEIFDSENLIFGSGITESDQNGVKTLSVSAGSGSPDTGQQIVSKMEALQDDEKLSYTDGLDPSTLPTIPTARTDAEIQAIVGAMFTGNSETNITSTYNTTTQKIDMNATGGTTPPTPTNEFKVFTQDSTTVTQAIIDAVSDEGTSLPYRYFLPTPLENNLVIAWHSTTSVQDIHVNILEADAVENDIVTSPLGNRYVQSQVQTAGNFQYLVLDISGDISLLTTGQKIGIYLG